MADFAADIRRIATVKNHPNADRLDLCTVEGLAFQFVTGRDQYKVGDTVVYIPIDSVVPDGLQELLGVAGKLGKKNRIRTIKLRGEFSQGMVMPCEEGQEYAYKRLFEKDGTMAQFLFSPGDDVTEALGITKYEPEEVNDPSGVLTENPFPIFDVQGCERYPEAYAQMLKTEVDITEKLEGTNFACAVSNSEQVVCQRRHAIQYREGNMYWEAAVDGQLLSCASWLHGEMGIEPEDFVIIRGELIGPGIQKNIYKLKHKEVRVFDIALYSVNGMWQTFLPAPMFKTLVRKFNSFNDHVLKPAPLLASGITLEDWLAGQTVQEASNGKSTLTNTAREGIIIRPSGNEQQDVGDLKGRFMLKQRSPEYLAKEK